MDPTRVFLLAVQHNVVRFSEAAAASARQVHDSLARFN
jgi:hypothetical protein